MRLRPQLQLRPRLPLPGLRPMKATGAAKARPPVRYPVPMHPEIEISVPEAALPTLLNERGKFLAFLERRTGSREVAEDLLHEAYLKGMERLDELRDEESAVAWFYRMLRNAVTDHHRRTGSSKRALEAFARELETVVPASDVHDEVCACITRLAAGLKPEYADALREVEVGGRSLKEYGEARGLTANNAGVRVHRARQALHKQVVAACGVCASHGCADCRCR